MVIKPEILAKINNVPSRKRIADKLDISDTTIWGLINKNRVYGRLTHLDALEAISDETQIPILELFQPAEATVVQDKVHS